MHKLIESFIPDRYDRNARLKPAMLTLLPVLITALFLIPEPGQTWSGFVILVLCGGGGMWLIQAAREHGKKLEPRLFDTWGGKPSVAMLRHSDCRLSKSLKARYHRFLKCRVPHLRLPTENKERQEPENADEAYEAANAWLLEQARDHPKCRELVFQENISYGFRRNLLGLKPFGMAVDAVLLLSLTALIAIGWQGNLAATLRVQDIGVWVGMCAAIIHASALYFFVKPDWVRTAAESYAQRLLASCDILSGEHIKESP